MSAPPETLRLFVALPVPGTIKDQLAALQTGLRSRLPAAAVSWPRLENLHVTLRFLGDVPKESVPSLKNALDAVAARISSMILSAEGVGCFPNLRRPAVLWVGVADDTGHLDALHQGIVAATHAFASQPAERDFTGHITLARFKRLGPREMEPVKALVGEAARHQFGSWQAEQFLVMRSELAPGGSHYTVLASFPLRDPGQR